MLSQRLNADALIDGLKFLGKAVTAHDFLRAAFKNDLVMTISSCHSNESPVSNKDPQERTCNCSPGNVVCQLPQLQSNRPFAILTSLQSASPVQSCAQVTSSVGIRGDASGSSRRVAHPNTCCYSLVSENDAHAELHLLYLNRNCN